MADTALAMPYRDQPRIPNRRRRSGAEAAQQSTAPGASLGTASSPCRSRQAWAASARTRSRQIQRQCLPKDLHAIIHAGYTPALLTEVLPQQPAIPAAGGLARRHCDRFPDRPARGQGLGRR
jgi:hypothetical protein